MMVNNAAPMQINMLVRRPEALCRDSRSSPTTAPKPQAINRRVVVPCRNAICSVVLKWTGRFTVVCLALRCDGNIRVGALLRGRTCLRTGRCARAESLRAVAQRTVDSRAWLAGSTQDVQLLQVLRVRGDGLCHC